MIVTDIEDSKNDNQFCEACVFGKHCRKPFNENDARASKPAELIHFDLCGPMSVESFGKNKYLLYFVMITQVLLMYMQLRQRTKYWREWLT